MPGPGRAREGCSVEDETRAVTTVPWPRLSSICRTPFKLWQSLLHHGEAGPDPADEVLGFGVGRREAGAEGGLLVRDAWPSVTYSHGIALVEDGDDDSGEGGVDEVVHQFPEDPQG